jgi:protein ImuB
MGRIACGYIARFELAVRARREPGLWQRPVVIADIAAKRARILAATGPAEQHGVRVGLPVAEALALNPQLELIAPDPALVHAAEREIRSALGKLSPAIDTDGLGAFFVSAEGLQQIHADEMVLARRLRAAFQELGYDARIGVADRSLAAWVAARRSSGITRVEPGQDTQSLADVRVEALGLPPPVLERFDLLGIRTVGQLAALPPGTLSARLPEGARIERFCRGEEQIAWPTQTQIPVVPEEVALDLDTPAEDLEPILFLFKSLLDQLLARVAQSRRALAELLIVVRHDDRSLTEHRLVPATPTLEGRIVLDLLRLWLSAQPFTSAVAGLRLVAARVDMADAQQLGLFERQQELADDALRRAAARLTAAFGPMAVTRPVLADTYRPEARLRWVPFTSPREKNDRVSTPPRPRPTGTIPIALRLFSPPQEVTQWDDRHLRVSGGSPIRIVRVEGPHRLSGEWWEAPFDRSYYWVTGSGGERLWLYRDELAAEGGKRIFVQALAD